MSLVVDASIAAAWVLPDEDNTAADAILHLVAAEGAVAPGLIWHELRNILGVAARRGRLPEAEIVPSLLRLRLLPLESVDVAAGGDVGVVALTARHRLTAYDAAYLALAQNRALPLATADRALRRAADLEGIELV
ncbi:type II toxin-antitoxin system VapC family toxin [Jannaschia rubra]|uniref:Ribonuclease VapC n=1 Tax=Jannaschia rubra TaxID=282197 RepID=A0A0M6XVV9_9RHOB|nr:type II toxin-antitoxin system VapC family toxin [Jannaschia rubra]CTQ34862.1 putative nucleic acid-binding protein, contains PIN domain [Jannaschia rubra]SFG67096.1 Predicted nucleic acid-binding protein, contains PIN domain [Jannaschia rubra]